MCYPLNRDLSRGYHYPPFKQLESEGDPLRKGLGNWSSGLGVQVAHLSMTYNVIYSEGSKQGGGHGSVSCANFDNFHISHALENNNDYIMTIFVTCEIISRVTNIAITRLLI